VSVWGATGKVLSNRPTDPNDQKAGFEVEIELDGVIGKITLTKHSNAPTMNDAIEDVRRKLFDFGVDLAKAFDHPGSLK
jgi:hypothetical protein